MRETLEARVHEILGYMWLSSLLENNDVLAVFSIDELQEFLVFLETGSYEKLWNFVQKKMREYHDLQWQAKNLEGKVKVEKQRTIEQAEQKAEEQELENLFNFE